ncbi:flagellar motor protein MotB [Chitinophaga silvatica]|uniref:Flagellar motor protein MotB n=1 Tax=Chitinophaga silvatica TaxID=2282649 RepID=A0A3E1Y262_9BACT|nr:OmpA family protein [Chitinophaga silvatica]RFS18751.1 flagellar motor protein MotB [Chitinophaga silvatica]
MNHCNKYILRLATLMVTIGISTHTYSQYVYTEAVNAYKVYNFEKAKPLFEKAYNKKPTAKAALGAANSYRLTKDYLKAEIWYARLLKTGEYAPAEELNYAAILMNNGKYDSAIVHLQHYLQKKPADQLALNMISGSEAAPKMIASPVAGKLENMVALNSPYSDWSITRFQEKFIFASDRPFKDIRKSPFFTNESDIHKKMYTWTGNSYLHLYESNGDSTDIKPMQRFGVNGAYHSSNATYSADGNAMFLAITRLKKRAASALGKDSILTMNISVRELKKHDQQNWKVAPEIPFNATLQYSVGDPWINASGDTLYFVASQGPDHQGGTDIYYAVKNNETWGNPINLGKEINTAGNERTPTFSKSGDLYFASDGHPGMGGLDIFMAVRDADTWKVKNLGVPVNSTHDDFAPSLPDTLLYFASNREGGKGSDDIYRFIPAPVPPSRPVFVINGIITDKKTGMPLPTVQILFKNKTTNVDTLIQTNTDGTYKFPADSGAIYELKITKTRYITIPRDTVSLKGYTTSVNIRHDKVMEQPEIGKPIRLENIYFDLGKSDIRPDAARELDKLVTILQDNPTWIIELGAHTDSRANDAYNLALSQRRATATVAYLVKKGINAKRLTAKGYGETRLINKCANGVQCSEAEHLLNRRTEFIILKF